MAGDFDVSDVDSLDTATEMLAVVRAERDHLARLVAEKDVEIKTLRRVLADVRKHIQVAYAEATRLP